MIKYLIITGANTAREINPVEKDPGFNYKKFEGKLSEYLIKAKQLEQWQAAEQSLKEYRIHGVYLKNSLPDRLTRWNRLHISTVEKLYPIGSTHKCEVSEETLTAIIL